MGYIAKTLSQIIETAINGQKGQTGKAVLRPGEIWQVSDCPLFCVFSFSLRLTCFITKLGKEVKGENAWSRVELSMFLGIQEWGKE